MHNQNNFIIGDITDKPWGNFEQFTLNQKSTIKIINVTAGKRLSLQFHHHRREIWVGLTDFIAQIGEQTFYFKKGEKAFIPQGEKHRLIALDNQDISILEIALGEFDENDIERIEDDFGRIQQ